MAGKVFLILIILSVLNCHCFRLRRDNKYELKQILILSRHNVRTPVEVHELKEASPKTWPVWKEKPGYLTEKGSILEGYMGAYFAEWFVMENILPPGCPGDDLYVYANVKERTLSSAKAFVTKGYPDCNVTVHHKEVTKLDPVFNTHILNDTLEFKLAALDEMGKKLSKLNISDTYSFMESLLNYTYSPLCLKHKHCSLQHDKTSLDIIVGQKPYVKGPLKTSNTVADAISLEYFEGFSDYAWGEIKNYDQWKDIMMATESYHDVIFNTTIIAKDLTRDLRKLIKEILISGKPKVTLLMGHDTNIITLTNVMGFKSYSLDQQESLTPIGGKIVFQKWYDPGRNLDLMKIDYVYQSNDQLRNSTVLSLSHPPLNRIMEVNGCNIDKDGFCLWSDFAALLNKL